MKVEAIRKIIGVILLVGLLGVGFYKPVKDLINIPNTIAVFEEQKVEWQSTLPSFITISAKSDDNIQITNSFNEYTNERETTSLTATEPGKTSVTFEVISFPVKQVNINVLQEVKVVPGGQSIGVKLSNEGVLVVGHYPVGTEDGDKSPGETTGIVVGDMITKINGQKIEKVNQVATIVQEAGEKGNGLKIELKRNSETLKKEIKPLRSTDENNPYRLGLYIKDAAAGVGTLSFYHPESKKYGALGHIISDVDTKKPVVVHDGQTFQASVTSIEKGSNGEPGEKLATFSEQRKILGTITENTPFGIFGELTSKSIENEFYQEAIPVALTSQVKEGPAKILTVVEGEEVQEFDVEIIRSVPQKLPTTKGLIIKVTDPKLLEATGGIVQGMSGSPIIQNSRVIGAVTHVFVNDPTSGYGVHIEWMLQEAGIELDRDSKAKAS